MLNDKIYSKSEDCILKKITSTVVFKLVELDNTLSSNNDTTSQSIFLADT